MKKNEKFYSEWMKIHSEGFFKYLLQYNLVYLKVIVVVALIGFPVLLFVQGVFYHESIALIWKRVSGNIRSQGLNSLLSFFVFIGIAEIGPVVEWYINEYRFSRKQK